MCIFAFSLGKSEWIALKKSLEAEMQTRHFEFIEHYENA